MVSKKTFNFYIVVLFFFYFFCIQSEQLYNATKSFEENINLTLLATGGVTRAEQFQELLDDGADIAMSGTGMMWDPYLASEYHHVQKKTLLQRLFEIDAIKFGNFTLRSGKVSPVYCDLRSIVSYPDILQLLSDCIGFHLQHINCKFICGVPYTGLPIATAVSISHSKPMVLKRKEAKEYGTKKMVEGIFKAGDSCVVIEDVITTGSSILETTQALEHEGLVINNIIVCIDRQQAGMECIIQKGYKIWALFTLAEILLYAREAGFINEQVYIMGLDFIRENKVPGA